MRNYLLLELNQAETVRQECEHDMSYSLSTPDKA